jgi:2-phospho-L-lactate guanylyltransferase
VNAAVLVPIKGFAAAKARLDGALDAEARASLAQELAATVIAAAAPLPVLVVCDDDDVAGFARRHGTDVLRQRRPGLNAAVAEGVEHLAGAGVERVVIAHADLPRATKLADLADGESDGESDGVVLVPDRHGDGLTVPTGVGFRFSYGPGSFAAHRAEAERLGLEVRVVEDDDLGWDIDTPADLTGL